MVWVSWRKYKALVKDCWPSDVADAAVNARNLDKLIIYSQATPNKLPEISACVEPVSVCLIPPLRLIAAAGTLSTVCRSILSGVAPRM
jgi:hypothetical protein